MKTNNFFALICSLFLIVSCRNEADSSAFEGRWKGIYTGTESGTWDININDQGVISGTAMASYLSDYEVKGTVTSEGSFKATVGTTSAGAVFTGQLSGNSGSETWTNNYTQDSGVWSGTKQ